MRLLERNSTGQLSLTKDLISDDDIPKYAILSHTWGAGTEEVTYRDLIDGTGKSKPGYDKIRFCAQQAADDGLQYFWVDTCCIDKSSSAELQEAINSMFRWYQNSAKCYVYLSDVWAKKRKPSDRFSEYSWESAFWGSRWFTRGWTLQELLAPDSVDFFSREGKRLGDKRALERQIHEITRIPITALRGTPLSQFNVEERLLWAESRQTTREEDRAYSLFGIFDIQIPVLYGEGRDKAFKRLREEIDKPLKFLDSLSYAVDAPFNSYAKQNSSSCLPDTRLDLLREIYSWADMQDERCIFWLNGLAGTGKSTIAHTIARNCYEQKRLGASFFFARGGGDVGYAGKFVTSIAVQLASSIPALRQYISLAVTEHSDMTSRSLRDQWQLLILGPLSKLDDNGRRASYILVVDALDECEDSNNIKIILQLLATARSLNTVQLRVFLTSRPEVSIRDGFNQMSKIDYHEFMLHRISPSIIDHDISIFLEYNLRLIGKEQFQDAYWPGAEAIKDLVQSASGLFIWAETGCRFIREGLFAEERLHILLEGSTALATPEEHLNRIYQIVLQNSIRPGYSEQERQRLYSMLKEILGSIVLLLSPLSIEALSKLLNITKHNVDRALKDLHAILDISEHHTRQLRLHHPSFRDFILNKDRCNDPNFWVDENRAHQKLAYTCLGLMSKYLKQDICSVDAPGVLVSEVESSQVEQYLPIEVQYACLHWVQHLQKSRGQLHDNDQVHQFLQTHFLYWLEALSWMQRMPEGLLAISLLESIILKDECPGLYAFVYDMKRFTLYSRPAIEHAPIQTYCSALLFTPLKSIVREQFKDRIPKWIQRQPKIQENWSALLQSLEGHSSAVEAVACSADGKLLASGSFDKTIRLWDTITGAPLHTLKGHSEAVKSIAFSTKGDLLVSGSFDKTLMLWDAGIGVLLQTLEGHSHGVEAVAFSADANLLASGSFDKTVKIWNAGMGTQLQTFKHPEAVYAVAFSANGNLLASGSFDNTIRLWDAGTGTLIQKLEGHTSSISALAFSPDGKLLASSSWDETVRMWDASIGTPLRTLKGHVDFVLDVAFSRDSKLIVSTSHDKTIRLWDAGTGAIKKTLGHGDLVCAVAFSADSKLLVSASGDNTVRLWDAGTLAPRQLLEGHTESVSAIAFSQDSKLLASVSDDKTLRLWDAGTGMLLQTLENYTGTVSAIAFSLDGKLLASGAKDKTVKLWDASTGALLQTLEAGATVKVLSFSGNGSYIETDRGRLEVNWTSLRAVTNFSPTPTPLPAVSYTTQRPDLVVDLQGIFSEKEWITSGKVRMLWLPPDYRPSCSAIRGGVVGLGHHSGRVSVFEFSFP